ncbi:MAG: ATP-dependent Clp protease proteolytic subunit, partial [Planctomycetes bacterium]|nr:ATP-dependent Clp protease proteolytic subunit [Planctomycetota bacterium]
MNQQIRWDESVRIAPVVGLALVAALTAAAVAQVASVESEPATTSTANAAIIYLDGEITDVMVESIRRRMVEAEKKGVELIIFDLDTPGGLVTSSIAIADLIKNLPDIKTVAWVNPNAHSGGAIVAVACDEIVMARSSRIGDSQVIMGGPGGVGAVPEDLQPKAYTPVLAEFRASARLNGYDQTLCEAFVLPDREVWWLENTKTEERKFVFGAEKRRLLGEREKPAQDKKKKKKKSEDEEDDDEEEATDEPEDDETLTEPAEQKPTDWKLVEKYHDAILDMEVDTIQPVVRDDQLLEMSAAEAQAYGFSKGIVANETELKDRYHLATIFHLAPSWSEAIAYWLTSMYVRGFLLLIIFLGAYVEFHTPGVGVAGLVALISLAIFVGAPYMTGLANIWEILCIVVGVLLMALEIFVIPGFGVAGILGAVCLLVGLVGTFVSGDLRTPTGQSELVVGLVATLTSLFAAGVVLWLVTRQMETLPVLGKLVLKTELGAADRGEGAGLGLLEAMGQARRALEPGDLGVAATDLRPAGRASFQGRPVDVKSVSTY